MKKIKTYIGNILPSMPFGFKKFIARVLLNSLEVKHMENDIILHNELKLWIDTNGRPTTSNINYHINKT